MFGDPVKNEKGWEKKEFKSFGKISTGNTPSRADAKNYDNDYIEWIKTDNIIENQFHISKAQEYLSFEGAKKGRIVKENSLLVTCIAGSLQSIGRAGISNRKIAFNQQINAIEPNDNVNISFLYFLVKNSRKYIQDHASSGMKRMLSKGEFEKIKMILPPINLQNQFAERVALIESQKQQAQLELAKSEELFQSLLQRAFKGELN
jgi:type I restriction enzyme S subunit